MTFIRKSTPLLLAVLSLVLAINQFVTIFSSDGRRNGSNEMVTKWEDHVRALREAIPPGVKQVGYVDVFTPEGDAVYDPNEFQLMQYSLAPVVLQIGTDHEWIVGNFAEDSNLEARLDEELGNYEIQGFGFGLYLIHDLGE